MALMFWYRFSEETLDASGNNNHIVAGNTPIYVKQLVDTALDSGSFVYIPNGMNKAYSEFSLCFKTRLTDLASNKGENFSVLVLDTDKIKIYITTADDKINFETKNDSSTVVTSTSTTVTQTGVDYDIQCIWDGTTQYLYINGTLEDSDSQSGVITLDGDNISSQINSVELSIDKLELHYKLNNDLIDSSGKGRDGTQGTPPDDMNFTTGKVGSHGGIWDRSVNQEHFLSPSIVLSTTNQIVTYTLWVKIDTTTDDEIMISDGNSSSTVGYQRIAGMANDNLRVGYANGSAISNTIFTDFFLGYTGWTYVVIEMDYTSKTGIAWRNNILISENGLSGTPVFPNQNRTIWFGGTDSGLYNFNGEMDEIRIYTRRLSSDERTFLYNDGAGIEANSAEKFYGAMDEIRFYDEEITANQRNRIRFFNDYYDVRIANKSYTEVLRSARYNREIDSVSANFQAQLFDPQKIIHQALTDDMDVQIYQDGMIVYRGQLDLYDNSKGITTTKGLDYMSLMFTKYAVAESFISRTRQFIIQYLIAKYVVKTRSKIYMSIDGVATGGTSTTILIDASATFESDNIEVGDIVVNTSDVELATIVSIDSETQITTSTLSGGASYNSGDFYGIIKDTINELTTETLSRSYPNTSLAEIFLTFANEEDGQMKIPALISLPLIFEYESRGIVPLQELGVDVLLDFDNPSNTTDGYKAYTIDFEQESRQVKNVFTVYGPSSSKVGATVRNWASIGVYGEKRAEPITDTDAITPTLCRARALEEQAKWENPKTKGTMYCNDKASFEVGKTVRVIASDYNISNVAYQIISATHKSFPARTTMQISSVIRTTDLLLADVLKKQREYDLRDANVELSNVSEYVTEDYMMDAKFTVSITGTAFTSGNSKVGIMQIGLVTIGNQDTSDLGGIGGWTDVEMILTNEGKDHLRDIIAGSGDRLDTTVTIGAHLQFGFNATDLDETLTEAIWTANYDIGDRDLVVGLSIGTNYKAIWDKTFDDTDLSGNPTVNKIAILSRDSSGVIIAFANLSASFQKVTGNNIVPEITMEVLDGVL